MGMAAEYVAEKYGVTRQMQDEYANLSYQRAIHSLKHDFFSEELVVIDDLPLQDEGLNPKQNYERMLRRLSPCFKENGTVTLGNCCGINDGAAAVLIMSEDKAKELGYKPIMRFVDSVVTGVNPNYPGTGPIPAVSQILSKHSLSIQDIDLIELNEAFASKVVACAQELAIPYEKLNVEGGAIALGHPYGASGAVLVTRLFYEVQRYKAKYTHIDNRDWWRNWYCCFMGEYGMKTEMTLVTISEEMVQNFEAIFGKQMKFTFNLSDDFLPLYQGSVGLQGGTYSSETNLCVSQGTFGWGMLPMCGYT